MTSEILQAADEGASEDRALLERLRAGEDAAFGELFSRHSGAVFRLALGLVNDRSEADDLTAEAFFRVLQAIRRGSGPVDNVRGYLLIVARRVAWEWSMRRRDVPVSDEELTHRAPSDPDTSGQFTERNLIRRAFTSLPERWRKVLWKMEVEGERPAVVATNFGLSPNATAALARRARQGLRAAYLQAHLASERSATGCRSVLEKLGAYTAGTTSGIERRRIRAHLTGCTSCTAMYAELRDVCSGLRAHAGLVAVPVVAAAGWQLAATVKGLFASTKLHVGLAATSAAAVGALGIVAMPWGAGDGDTAMPLDLDGKRGVELQLVEPPAEPPTSLRLTGGSLDGEIVPPDREYDTQDGDRSPLDRAEAVEPAAAVEPVAPTSHEPPARDEPAGAPEPTADGGRSDQPLSTEADAGTEAFDETVPIVYRETTVQRSTEDHEHYTLVHETTTTTEVNTLNQTRTTSRTTSYRQPKPTGTPPARVGTAPNATAGSAPTT